MNKIDSDFNSQMQKLYGADTITNVTFQITDDCPMACIYCYQGHKGHRIMSKETAKKAVDLLFKMYDEDKPDGFISHKTDGIILDFIGGEPLMNVEIIEYICDYFFDKCYEINSPWLLKSRISMISNGILYFDPKVQHFLEKYNNLCSFNITIDGPKHIHDSCRVLHDGSGSYDRAIAALTHYRNTYGNVNDTKVTIAPENLEQINEIIKFFIEEQNITNIHANCTFEAEWTVEHAKIFYNELKKMSNYLLSMDDLEDVSLSLFSDRDFIPLSPEDNNNWCGGTGKMLSFDPDGIAYPCIRYMESSLGKDQPPVIIGDVNGIYESEESKKIMDEFAKITRRSQSTDECFDCEIAAGCAWCFPAGTKVNTPTGLVNIEDIQAGDKVLDKDGNSQRVLSTTSHVATDIVQVKAAGLHDLITTKSHPFWAKRVVRKVRNYPVYGEPEWIPAGELNTSDKIALYVPKIGNIEIDPHLAYIIGRYVGDGWKSASNRVAHPYRYYICCDYNETNELEEKLSLANIKFSKSNNKTCAEYNLNITGQDLLVSLLDQCGLNVYTKRVPQIVFSWNQKGLEAFLTGYFDADGSVRENEQRYCTVSKELALNIATLVRMTYHKNVSISVRHPSKTTVIEGRTVNQSISYECVYKINPAKMFYEYDEKLNIMWVNIRPTVYRTPKEALVYNLSVENTESYIADGALVHNCSGWNYQLYGTADKRCTRICWMHRARALANVYFWNLYYKQYNINKKFKLYLKEETALQIIDKSEYDMLKELST